LSLIKAEIPVAIENLLP